MMREIINRIEIENVYAVVFTVLMVFMVYLTKDQSKEKDLKNYEAQNINYPQKLKQVSLIE